jgi:hypothetical protein
VSVSDTAAHRPKHARGGQNTNINTHKHNRLSNERLNNWRAVETITSNFCRKCYGLVLGFDSRWGRGLGIFLFTTVSTTALVPTQPPIQWVPGAVSLGIKRPGREADHSVPPNADVKERLELYLISDSVFIILKHISSGISLL